MASAAQRAQLLAHPDTPGEWVWSIGAEMELTPGAALVCRYELHGEVDRLRVPAARADLKAGQPAPRQAGPVLPGLRRPALWAAADRRFAWGKRYGRREQEVKPIRLRFVLR